MQDKLVVYYLRHGENEANLEGVFTSRKLDHNAPPLSTKG